MKTLVIQGPNINMLGVREKGTYGSVTMEKIHDKMKDFANKNAIDIDFFQSNSEGALVSKIQESIGQYDYIIINPAAYTHTSIAIRDALLSVSIPIIEVHLSNIFKRENFRHHSYISDIAVGVISGFKEEGYIMGLKYIKSMEGKNEG